MKRLNKLVLYALLLGSFTGMTSYAQKADISWPQTERENQPGARWWWLGNAVDKEGLTMNMENLHNVGIGAVEITPVYGIQGSENRHINYLSPQWMEMYKHTYTEGLRLNMEIGMSNGTGWPFGGPEITREFAATKAIFQKYVLQKGQKLSEKIIVNDPKQKEIAKIAVVMAYSSLGEKLDITSYLASDGTLDWTAPNGNWTIWAVFNGKTLQKVKRSAPGAEGLVMNHFSKDALSHYLKKFDDAFSSAGANYPHTFFNDSYEVYGGDWSENLFQEFELRRGYKLQDYIPELNREGNPEVCARVVCDYRETISDMLLHNFTIPWTEWAHAHGAITRNQAHGSPGNLIDFYGAVDIPECESFGRTRFNIPGLRVDSGMKESDSHPSVLKYASSAAHITGKKYTSSETFTWLTEHFRTSLSQMKPELDLMFLSGVNHMFYHGSTYSPKDAVWPGWLFYASVNMNINNTIFKDAKGLNDYITRTQSFLQYGEPDNDFLLYIPIYDLWQELPDLYLTFDIHKMKDKTPDFFDMVVNIQKYGYDTDYISDKYIQQLQVENNMLKTQGASYKAIIIPNVKYISIETMSKLVELGKQGATIIFTDQYPQDVPGMHDLEKRRSELKKLNSSIINPSPDIKGKFILGKNHTEIMNDANASPEVLNNDFGVQLLRRKHSQGHLYFLALLENKPLSGYVPLSVDFQSAMIFNPLTGESGKAQIRKRGKQNEIYLQMEPGQSLIVKTFTNAQVDYTDYLFFEKGIARVISGDWEFRFTDGTPVIPEVFQMKGSPVSWTELKNDSAIVFAGTGRYSIVFDTSNEQADEWSLDLGKLCESARVYLNDQDVGIVWSLPFTANIGKFLKKGKNKLEIDVTNLPANRIRDYDKRGVNWRIFHDINVVSVFYKNIRFDSWAISPSGLAGSVTLTPLYKQKHK